MTGKIRLFALVTIVSILLAACGGGGGGGGTSAPPTKVLIKISTNGVPTGTLIGGAQGKLVLPVGVTPSVAVASDVVGTSDVSGSIVGYNPSTDSLSRIASYVTATRTLTFARLEPSTGFAQGEVMTITCNIAANTTVSATDIPAAATIVSVFDTNTQDITGASLPISLTFQ
jgi:hypothetical protein